MKTQVFLNFVANTLMALTLLSTAAWATGQHAGGHEHDAIGKPGVASKDMRTVDVAMLDSMRFAPAQLDVKQGETIRFIVKNLGKLKHEFVLGTEKELKAHYALMLKNPEMEHDDPNSVSVEPGKTGVVIWQFTKAGRVDFACLHPGHYDAGMKGFVRVSGSANRQISTAPEVPSSMPQKDDRASNHTLLAQAAASGDVTEGEIRKVDKDTQKITIRHGAIKNLDMPAMTMVFRVQDPAMLDQVKAGAKIGFVAEKINGALMVTRIELAK